MNLKESLTDFSRLLRQEGIKLTVAEVLDAARALSYIDLMDRGQFYHSLRITLVKKGEFYELYDRLFRLFWEKRLKIQKEKIESINQISSYENLSEIKEYINKNEKEGEEVTLTLYSPIEIKNIKILNPKDSYRKEIQRNIRRFKRFLATLAGRRVKSAIRGDIDPRKILRKNLGYGGELIKVVKKRKVKSRAKIILLCDVSGSMDGYSDYLVELLYHFKNSLHNTEVFLFSTNLIRITNDLSQGSIDYVARSITKRASIWGSGTKIGYCLGLFVKRYPELIDYNSILVIVSDGWDVGDIDELKANLRWLKERVSSLVWLNPLLDIQDYKPETLGMKIALPYIDIFASLSIFKDSKIYEKYFGKAIRYS
ncbi:MAG: VWA domain-containing protein [Nitrososphaerales archaeon]